MKRLLTSLITGLGAFALVAVLAPSEASAQQCRSSSSYGQRSSHSYGYAPTYRTTRQYAAPVRRSRGYTSARVVVNPHYGNGSIYYRSNSYARPQARHYSNRRQVTRSRGRCYRR